ncbi:polysaccharide biosynthesis/export family protein [Pseudorhodoplanes sp.]|uniref:polysaccharide biosynthesis/export family protein n=1 Tax=Pseudorhodoplanes sp. TaxID=1934341 RepID=UPI003D14D84D
MPLRHLSAGLCCALVAALAGCAALPSAGPTTAEVVANESHTAIVSGYVVVDIDARVTSVLSKRGFATLYGMFRDSRRPPDVRIGTGDFVTITIWEAGAGGLFSTASLDRNSPGSRTATIPEQEVSQNGTVQVPYAGRLKLAGLRPADAESLIVESLKGKAIEPQAVVTITKNRNNTVTVTGEVTNGMLAPVSVKGDRVLDVIASAGGLRAPGHEVFVRLSRGEKSANVPFNRLLADARENVYVRPGDVLTVLREPQLFTAFGGTGRNALIPFDAAGMTLEQAIAKAGGLLDYRADSTGVFLLRFEPAPLVAELAPERAGQFETAYVPVVYRLNLRDANSYFMARAFPMRNNDILYVANAPLTEVQKFLSVVGSALAPAAAGAAMYNLAR